LVGVAVKYKQSTQGSRTISEVEPPAYKGGADPIKQSGFIKLKKY